MGTGVYRDVNGERQELSEAELAQTQALAVDLLRSQDSDFIPVSLMRQRIEAKGLLDEFSTYLAQNPTLMMKLLTLEGGAVDPAYPAIVTAFNDMALPADVRSYILAPASEGIGVP